MTHLSDRGPLESLAKLKLAIGFLKHFLRVAAAVHRNVVLIPLTESAAPARCPPDMSNCQAAQSSHKNIPRKLDCRIMDSRDGPVVSARPVSLSGAEPPLSGASPFQNKLGVLKCVNRKETDPPSRPIPSSGPKHGLCASVGGGNTGGVKFASVHCAWR